MSITEHKIYVNDTHTRYHDKLYSLTTRFIDFIDLSIFRIFLFDNFSFLPKYTFRNNLFCILPILPLIFIIVSVYRFFSLWICPIWTKSFYVWNIFVSVNFVFVFFSFFLFCKCSFCICTCALLKLSCFLWILKIGENAHKQLFYQHHQMF